MEVVDKILIDKDKENIKLRNLNNKIEVDVDCEETDKEYHSDDDNDDGGGHDTCDELPPEINMGDVPENEPDIRNMEVSSEIHRLDTGSFTQSIDHILR